MKYLLRLMVFILRNLVLTLLVGALAVIAFTLSMDASNVYIVANDGMEMRAEVILGLDDPEELTKFFTVEAIDQDQLAHSLTYIDYNIRGCDYRAQVESLWIFPWDSHAQIRLVEHIPTIDGDLPISKQTEEQLNTPGKILPPAWQDGRYQLTFTKADGRWKISGVQLVALVDPLATHAPQLTSSPSPSPVPSATAEEPSASPSISLPASAKP